VVLCILTAGCIATQPVPPPPIKTLFTYLVGPGDVLEIEVWKEPDLVRACVVAPDGSVTFPIIGSIVVMDKSIPEIADLITLRLSDALTAPLVTVTLKESRSSHVQVMGEVMHQGAVPYHDRLTLIDALGMAGGVMWATAKSEAVHVVRGRLDDPVLIQVDLDYVMNAAGKDVFLEPGDLVVVPPMWMTRFDRYVRQVLSPFQAVAGAGQQAVNTATYGTAGRGF
jgi:polysaccharide export outer membrane protein